jgi:hypothetical protein
MKVQKIIPEKIHLNHIVIVKNDITGINTSLKTLDIQLGVAHTIMHNLKEERIKIGLLLDLLSESVEKENNVNMKFNIDFHYKIDDLINHYELDENNSPIFSGQFIATLLGISFSTARGIIYQKLSDVNLKGIILPVVSPQKMLNISNK